MANMFAKMMSYAQGLNKGVTPNPDLAYQSNLLWACKSEYSSLAQKNEYCDLIAREGFDIVGQDGYVVNNYWNGGYAQ